MAEADGAQKKKKKTNPEASGDREGKNLLGSPTYTELSNGRFRCLETGHELPAREMESYGQSKRCRLGMIEFAMKNKKPPLNMFKGNPNNSSKLICKLTGDVVNKSEEHIWKHLNGKQLLYKLEQREMGKLVPNGGKQKGDERIAGNESGASDDKKKKRKKKIMKEKKKLRREVDGEETEAAEAPEKCEETEEIDFWVPPVGSRWDNDEGGDRWGSESESDGKEDTVEDNGDVDDEAEDIDEVIEPELTELFRSKRALDDNVHSSSNSTKKKKKKKNEIEAVH